MEDERIKWQFAPDFYKSKNTALDQSTALISMGDYETAFTILKMTFLSIAEEIKNFNKEDYDNLKTMAKTIEGLNLEYGRYSKSPAYQNRKTVKKASITLFMIREMIDNFYEQLHNQMWKLNMLVPKEKIDRRKDIFKG